MANVVCYSNVRVEAFLSHKLYQYCRTEVGQRKYKSKIVGEKVSKHTLYPPKTKTKLKKKSKKKENITVSTKKKVCRSYFFLL